MGVATAIQMNVFVELSPSQPHRRFAQTTQNEKYAKNAQQAQKENAQNMDLSLSRGAEYFFPVSAVFRLFAEPYDRYYNTSIQFMGNALLPRLRRRSTAKTIRV